MNIVYSEVVKTKWSLLHLVLIIANVIVAGFLFYMNYQQLILKIPVGNKPTSDGILIFLSITISILMLTITFIIFSLKLKIQVSSDTIIFKMTPFHINNQKIQKKDIEDVSEISFSTFKDFGGYGIRYGNFGKAYVVNNKQGVKIRTKNSTNIILSSNSNQLLLKSIRNLTTAST